MTSTSSRISGSPPEMPSCTAPSLRASRNTRSQSSVDSSGPELTTDEWLRVLRQARELGTVQLGISGGEPLMRDDVEVMVAEAHRLGYYANLLTSGVGLTEKRIAAFKEGGLDQIQLSFQDSTRELNDFLSSTRTFELKSKVAKLIKQYEYPMVLNVVLHRLMATVSDKAPACS